MAPRRFLRGLSSVAGTDPLGAFPYLDPRKYSVTMLDFFKPHFGAALNNGNATYDGLYYVASANATIDCLVDDNANGVLRIVTTAADNESGTMGAVAPSMRLRTGKKCFMQTKFKTKFTGGVVGQDEMFIGLAGYTNDGTPAHTDVFNAGGSAIIVDDAIGWSTVDGVVSVYHECRENDVGTTTDTTYDIVDDTWVEMGMYFDGTDIELWVDKVSMGSYTPTAFPVSAIGPAITYKSGEAKVHSLLVDYLYVACER